MPDGGPPARSLSEAERAAEAAAREELCQVCRLLYQRGYTVGHDGNVSLRLGEDQILVTPSGVGKGRLRPGMLVRCALSGEVLEGERHPSSEIPMHLLVYRERPDVRAVVHAHPPMATAFAVCRRPLRERYLTETISGLGEVPVAPFALPSTQEVPDSVRPFVRDHSAVLLANHGALTWGPDLWSAFDRMETVEQTARIYANVQLLGGGVELTEAQKVRLMAAIDELKETYDAGGCPCSVTAPDGKPVEYTFFRPRQYGEKYLIKEWPSFNAMLEGYYAEKDRAERLRTKSKELHKAVHNMYERAVRKQAARQEELAASGKSEKLRLYGELLSANLYLAEKGMKSITVPNWYDEGKEVTIPLDLRFSPSQNAQNFFKNYKKKQTAARMLVDLLAEGEKEIAYLETVLYEVETASGEAALNEIRAELKSQGYLKYYKQRDKRQKPADFLRFTSSDGFEILVGRNNAQNDKLTLHTARGKDLWFHVQKAPGSHVVVMSRGEDIPDTTKQESAELAVVYSSTFKAGAAAKVAVDTTEVKNIWKANGAKPGMVLYEVYTTVYVTPREKLLDELKANEKK